MRSDDDAAFRARQAANTVARDTPNILAWVAEDVLLDALGPERREFLPGLSAKSPACISSGSLVLIDRPIVWKSELRCILRIL
jgi:hypothetical protein